LVEKIHPAPPEMSTAIVLPSAVRRANLNGYTDAGLCNHTSITLAFWPCIIVHGHFAYTKGHESELVTKEAVEYIGVPTPFIGTLGRGAVHHDHDDPLNGFIEHTGGMSYNIWPWKVVIEWLTNGWPSPSQDSVDTPAGAWCWHKQERLLLPEFDRNEKKQLASMRVPSKVIEGKRLMTPEEAVDVACSALRKQKTGPRNKYFRR